MSPKKTHSARSNGSALIPKTSARQSMAANTAVLLVALCPRVMQTVRRRMHEGPLEGVTLTQQRILKYVAENPGVGLSELAAHFMVSAPSASNTVTRLARQRLLNVRTRPDNRRRIALTLTASGQSLVDRALTISQREVKARLESIAPADLKRAMPVLRQLLQNFQ